MNLSHLSFSRHRISLLAVTLAAFMGQSGVLNAAQFVPTAKTAAAINTAISNLYYSTDGGEVFLPAGEYIIDQAIRFPSNVSRSITIRGEGQNVTRLKVTTASIGIDLDLKHFNNTVTLNDFTIFTESAAAETAIKITYPNPSGDAGTHGSKRHRNPWATLERVHIRCGDSGGKFAKGIDLHFAWNTKIRDCQISGYDVPGFAYTGTAITISKQSNNSVIENCQINFWARGIEIIEPTGTTPRQEGLQVSDSSFVGVGSGIYYNPSSKADSKALYWLSVHDCHFDVRSTSGGAAFGLFLPNTKESVITGNLIYAGMNTGFKACIWVWGDMVNIANNQLRPWAYAAGDSGNGVVVGDAGNYNSTAIAIVNNVVWELQNGTGFWLQQGSSECRVIGNMFKDCSNYTKVINQGAATNYVAYN